MEKETSKELLELERKGISFSSPAAEASILHICRGDNTKSRPEKPKLDGDTITSCVPQSQVLGRVKDFLGVISEANKSLQVKAKEKPEEYDIEVLNRNESNYIEMDLMLGIADLHTPEAIAAAEAAISSQPAVLDLPSPNSSSESESGSGSDDDDDESEEESQEDDDHKGGENEMTVLGIQPQRDGMANVGSGRNHQRNRLRNDKGFKARGRKRRPKIIEV